MSDVTLSADRRILRIIDSQGPVVTHRSELPTGFTPEQVDRIRAAAEASAGTMLRGQINRMWRWTRAGRDIFLHINTGPPTCWLPLLEFESSGQTREVRAVWLRGLIAVAVMGASAADATSDDPTDRAAPPRTVNLSAILAGAAITSALLRGRHHRHHLSSTRNPHGGSSFSTSRSRRRGVVSHRSPV